MLDLNVGPFVLNLEYTKMESVNGVGQRGTVADKIGKEMDVME